MDIAKLANIDPTAKKVKLKRGRTSELTKQSLGIKANYTPARFAKTDKVLYKEDGSIDISILSQGMRKFLTKFVQENGVVARACAEAGVSRDTYYRWLKENKTFDALVARASEEPADAAEVKLWEKIHDGNLQATMFYLRSHHPRYKEKSEVNHKHTLTTSWYEDMKAQREALPDDKELKKFDRETKTIEGEIVEPNV